ncbi:MAG: metallophosphoesterase family protein [Planctomycetota bacterium]
MLYGVMSDIHGNLEALEAVLIDMHEHEVDRIVCLGDVIGYGPCPYETAELVSYVAAACVHGNHEQMVLRDRIDEYVSPLAATAARWTRKRLKPRGGKRDPRQSGRQARNQREIWRWLKSLPQTLRHEHFLFAHGTPEDAECYIITLEEALKVFKGQMDGAQILFVGHSHVPGIFHLNKNGRVDYAPGEFGKRYRIGKRPMIVNVGSVGQPRDYDSRACYVLTDGKTIRYRRIEYDVESTVERIYKESGLPNALADRLLCGE